MICTIPEIIAFWQGYCQRNRVPLALQLRGEQEIQNDPEYWEDHEMRTLWDTVEQKVAA